MSVFEIFRASSTVLPLTHSVASELEAMGFRLGIYPSQTQRAAIRAAQKVLRALQEDGDTRRVEADLATFAEREAAVGADRWRALEAKYLRTP